mmetsp:Transcript_79328/g.256893  ORF Transcript_79328/g.256893 Transcript_79328/m.256893 type:complete len:272 (+) Transcript_79328:2343-3158(+)
MSLRPTVSRTTLNCCCTSMAAARLARSMPTSLARCSRAPAVLPATTRALVFSRSSALSCEAKAARRPATCSSAFSRGSSPLMKAPTMPRAMQSSARPYSAIPSTPPSSAPSPSCSSSAAPPTCCSLSSAGTRHPSATSDTVTVRSAKRTPPGATSSTAPPSRANLLSWQATASPVSARRKLTRRVSCEPSSGRCSRSWSASVSSASLSRTRSKGRSPCMSASATMTSGRTSVVIATDISGQSARRRSSARPDIASLGLSWHAPSDTKTANC